MNRFLEAREWLEMAGLTYSRGTGQCPLQAGADVEVANPERLFWVVPSRLVVAYISDRCRTGTGHNTSYHTIYMQRGEQG